MNYKLIATDMDGTLLDEEHNITKENIEEILNILENIIYENSMIYNSIYRIIIETRRRVKINCNFEMTKDYLILNIWDKSNIERK